MAKRSDVSWISGEGARRAKSAIAVVLSFAVLLGGAGFAGWKGYEWYVQWQQRDDYKGDGETDITIIIPAGAGWAKVADTLVVNDVIKDQTLFVPAALKLADGPQPGQWHIKTHLPAATAAKVLVDPKNVDKVTFTIPEGLRLDQILTILSDKVGVSRADWDAAVAAAEKDPKTIGLNAAAGKNLEGFLFPATYTVYPPVTSDATSILAQMADKFNTVASSIDLTNKAKKLKLTAAQAVTIASIIEAEVSNPEDQAKVARAILNRVAADMPLGVESVFRYGRLVTDGVPYADPITAASQEDDTLPYNYYIKTGIPKFAIGNPGQAALEAAVNPADGDWLYWVTVNLDTGETGFAADEAGYAALADQFHQWCADNGNPTGCQ